MTMYRRSKILHDAVLSIASSSSINLPISTCIGLPCTLNIVANDAHRGFAIPNSSLKSFHASAIQHAGERRLSKSEKARLDDSPSISQTIELADEDFLTNELAPMQCQPEIPELERTKITIPSIPLGSLGPSHLHQAYLVPRSLFHERLARDLVASWSLCQVDALQYRPITHDLIQYMDACANKPSSSSSTTSSPTSPRNDDSMTSFFLPTPTPLRGGRRTSKLLLEGAPGSGKTTLLLAAVQHARASGWAALYIPSSFMLTGLDGWPGGFYHEHSVKGTWNTPDIARRIMEDLLLSHKGADAQLNALSLIQCKLPSTNHTGSLASFLEASLAKKSEHWTDAALAVLQELQVAHEVPVLLAMDDYHALYGYSVFGHWASYSDRRTLLPHQLRIANAFRFLDDSASSSSSLPSTAEAGSLLIMASLSGTKPLPLQLVLPISSDTHRIRVPPLSRQECVALVQHLVSCHVATMPRSEDVDALLMLAQGDGRRVMRHAREVDYCRFEAEQEGLVPGAALQLGSVPLGAPAWGLAAPRGEIKTLMEEEKKGEKKKGEDKGKEEVKRDDKGRRERLARLLASMGV